MSKKALISVSDKTGVVELAQVLTEKGYEILSTGGTANLLKENGVPVVLVESYTGFPEILDGRVKTLQPKIHAGILANRKLDSHLEEMKKLDFGLIDVVVVNLYPFQQTVAKPDVTLEDAVENIDIGGITLIRAAAKNFDSVAIICDPADYGLFVKEVKEKNGASAELRKKLAVKAFKQTRDYDKAISDFLEKTLQ